MKRCYLTLLVGFLLILVGCATGEADPPPEDTELPTSVSSPSPTAPTPIDQESLDEALLQAIILGEATEVAGLLEVGANPDAVDSKGEPLLRAVLMHSPDLVGPFLEHGASVSTLDSRGNALLALAADENAVEYARALLEAGADVDGTLVEGTYFRWGRKPLDGGVNTMFESALSVAAGRGYVEMVTLLIAHGADVDMSERLHQFSPLHIAVAFNQAEAIQLLLDAGADPNQRCSRRFGEAPLHLAARSGALESVRVLVDGGAAVNQQTDNGLSPLQSILYWGNPLRDRVEIATVLLNGGADPNLPDTANGRAALHYSAENGLYVVFPILLEHGAAIDQQDNKGETPLHLAAEEGQVRAVAGLLENGARTDLTNEDGETAADVASSDEILELIAAAGEDS